MKKGMIIFEQPAGKFGLTTLDARTILRIALLKSRIDDPEEGIQRKFSPNRVKKIAEFIDNSYDEVAFPTPIIMSLPLEDDENKELPYKITEYANNNAELDLDDTATKFANLIDGQHRILGITQSKKFQSNSLELEMPVIFVIDADLWTRAYLFAKINGEQRQVPYSFIADLFGLSPNRSIEKIAHQMVYVLNTNNNSPFQGQIKMLGLATDKTQTLSQGTMVREFQKLIDKHGILHEYYVRELDTDLFNIIIYYFTAIRDIWRSDWDDAQGSVIRKTVGFLGFIKAFPDFYNDYNDNAFSVDGFKKMFKKVDTYFIEKDITSITTNDYPSNASGASKLRKDIIAGLKN